MITVTVTKTEDGRYSYTSAGGTSGTVTRTSKSLYAWAGVYATGQFTLTNRKPRRVDMTGVLVLGYARLAEELA